ncbi:MAG: hypothetical protein DI547_06925 [Sphingobium sp.]|nr:MAG: hypothetical protein DI547_06925 [Sphingobium sp.]
MQFLKTALWVVLAVALALFCKANWISVPVKLWGDLVADAKLPVLVVGAFVAGAAPFWIVARATRWRMRKRLESAERALASATAAAAATSPPPPAPPSQTQPDLQIGTVTP